MGQAMTSETLSIQGEDGFRYWVGLQAKPFHRGYKKTTYKGVLLGQGSRQWEKVSVKAFTNLPNTRANWQREIDKARETKEMVAKFKEAFPAAPELTVILSCLVQMDKVSKVNRWLERRHGFSALNEDDWVAVEKHVSGPVHLYCPWSEWPPWRDLDVLESEHLSAFSHFTYWASDGGLVVCDIVAAAAHDDDTAAGYAITDVIVHSREKQYGHFDQGESGIIDFFICHRCTELCKGWPRLGDAAKQDMALEDDDGIDAKRKVHFNLKLDKVFFARSSFKQKFPALRRHASDEGAKLRKKWMDRFSRNHPQLHPLPVKDGPPPYDDLPNVQAHHRTKSWTISEFSYQGSSDEARSRARDAPAKSCLKRTASDQRVSLSSTDL